MVLAEGDGVVTKVNAREVTVKYDNGKTETYYLRKFARSNQGTCINQRPIVSVGERLRLTLFLPTDLPPVRVK